MFKRFTSKPREVEAVQFTMENKDQVFNSMAGDRIADFEHGAPILEVMTIHRDVVIVRIGDWIVKEAKPGFYYPVKDYAFKLAYEAKP